MSAKVNNEEHMMQAKHETKAIFDTDKIVEELFDLLVERYQLGLE